MPNKYHILNGDALKEQLPEEIPGEIIVFRECLMGGPVQAENIAEFFNIRAKFIAEAFGEDSYSEKSAPELSKITEIPDRSVVNLWFEDDLFCQVNFWCAVDLLSSKDVELFLVRPESHTRFGFGRYKPEKLPELLENRIPVQNPRTISSLWKAYQRRDLETMTRIAKDLMYQYPFITDAVEAHIQRQPGEHTEGRPVESLKKIIQEIGSDSFGAIF